MNRTDYISMFFAAALLCLFTVCALLLSVTGARVYKKQNAASETGYNIRTSLLYISEKLRQNDGCDTVYVSDVNGASALVLKNDEDGYAFETWIFVSNEKLYEASVSEGMQVSASVAQQVLDVDDMEFEELGSGLIRFCVSVGGKSYSTSVMPRCRIGGGGS